MEVSFSDSFKKVFRKRIKSTVIENEFWSRLELFINDPFDTNKTQIGISFYALQKRY